MKRFLVTYATYAGSTVEVAQAIGDELVQQGHVADVRPLDAVKDLAGYAGVVVGGPMIMGWHRAALGFLKRHRRALRHTPLAVFIMAMSLTQTGETSVDGVPVQVDASLLKPPERPGRLSFRERYAQVSNYVRPILGAVRPAKPAGLAIFGGRLEFGRLTWWAMLFVLFIVQARAGDQRNWPLIRAWAAGLPKAFERQAAPAERVPA
ncbi:MAG: hypothetical protein IT318_15180 [Anaerolineales bacterium]|nr:hypothetical protein [Anaerolineales bacterium]